MIVAAFFCSTVSILLIADNQLTDILDNSKNELYKEKIDAIWSVLHQNNNRLEQTGLIETYLEDFKATTLKELKQTYYGYPALAIYPFIIDTVGNLVMHPVITENTALPDTQLSQKMFAAERGEFNYVYQGQLKYYVFRSFPEWNWIVAYAVPLEIKYAEARKFRNLLFLILTGVSLSILIILSIMIARFTKPISRLTRAAKAMADGKLDEEIPVIGNDEIGTLAYSFNDMRRAVKKTIHELELENRERKNAENALANEKEQLAVTLISIGDGVITTDIRGQIVLMNKVAEELTGWNSREVIGRDLKDVFNVVVMQDGAENRNVADQLINNAILTGGSGRAALISRNGDKKIIAGNGAPIKDTQKNIIGTIHVFRDITNQVNTERELLKTRKLESIGVLAGGIAHDFNNILTVVLGNINLALHDSGIGEKTRKMLTNVDKAGRRAQGLTQQLLTFSKGGAPVKAVSSLESIIRDSADFVLHGRSVACNFDIPHDLWFADVDKGQISQVIQNIVLNGCEAIAGSGEIAVSCKNIIGGDTENSFLVNGQKYVGIFIADSGRGIPEAIIENIFDPYFTTKTTGNGLGLAIAHSIISKHNGHIDVQSSTDKGTVFTIYLPATDRIEVVAEINETNIDSAILEKSAKIMIMDDEELVREMITTMLEEMGHTVLTAVNGEDALELYKKNKEAGTPVDIVIMDLTIPGGMGGKEAIKKLLGYDSNAIAIVSSGYSNDPVMANPVSFGFKTAIVKPYSCKELDDVIKRVFIEQA